MNNPAAKCPSDEDPALPPFMAGVAKYDKRGVPTLLHLRPDYDGTASAAAAAVVLTEEQKELLSNVEQDADEHIVFRDLVYGMLALPQAARLKALLGTDINPDDDELREFEFTCDVAYAIFEALKKYNISERTDSPVQFHQLLLTDYEAQDE